MLMASTVMILPIPKISIGVAAFERGDYETAREAFTAAASARDPNACLFLGYMYDHGLGLPEDPVEAVGWYRLAAVQHVPQAAYNLGLLTMAGRGVRADVKGGAALVREDAVGGYAPAQAVLGRFYLRGEGVPRDPAIAAHWLSEAAAQQGYAPSQFALGVLYDQGLGVPHDQQRAIALWTAAAESGFPEAQSWLGSAALAGSGTARDASRALNLFRAAAEGGSATGQARLAGLYLAGVGVKANFAEALFWSTQAAAVKNPSGQRVAERAAAAMAPKQVAEVRAKAAAWRPLRRSASLGDGTWPKLQPVQSVAHPGK
jgi:TPR repeat protein